LPKIRAAATEELRLRQQLRMHLKAYNDFVVSHRAAL
jgi:hypothetical protein